GTAASNQNGMWVQAQSVMKGNGYTLMSGHIVQSPPADSFSNIQNFVGGSGNDTMIDGPGLHSFDGGGGADKLILHGAFAEYSEWSYLVVAHRWHTVVADNGGAGDGTVDLVGVEQLQDSTGKLVNIV